MPRRREQDDAPGVIDDPAQTRVPGTEGFAVAADRLRSLVERIERVEQERRELGADIKDLYAEAKSAGFDSAVLRRLVAERRKEPAEVEAQDDLLDVYRRALG
jgi:uncharacterized protein (UPF0335 family)